MYSTVPGDDLRSLIDALEHSLPDEAAALVVEPAYRAALPELEASRESLRRALRAIDSAGFPEAWRSEVLPGLREEIARLEPALGRLRAGDARDAVAALLGRRPPLGPIHVVHFGRPYARTLVGGGALVPPGLEPESLWPTRIHEWLHAFDPSAEALALYEALGKRDDWVGARRRAILADHHSSNEEEMVLGAELALSVRLGLSTRPQAFRRAAVAYGGAPVAAFLLDRLLRGGSAIPYDEVVRGELRALLDGPDVSARYAALVRPVSGTTGMRLEIRGGRPVVAFVAADSPAARAGIEPGDAIRSIEGRDPPAALAEVVEALVGPAGEDVGIVLERGGCAREVRLVRGRLPGLP